MAKRIVIWTRTADLQFVGILEYWIKNNKSSSYSKKLLRLVVERTQQIAKTPLIYKPADFNDLRLASIRHYSIYYKIADEQIIIGAFWDNRQDPKELLKVLQNKK